MYIQVLLTAAAIICMFSQVFANNFTTTPKQLVQIKDILCALLLSGAPVDEFDGNTVKKLQKYNLNLENMSEQELNRLCRVSAVTESIVYRSPQIETVINYLSDLKEITDDANNNEQKNIQDQVKLNEGINQNSKFIPTVINRITIRNSPESYNHKDTSQKEVAADMSNQPPNKTNTYDIYEGSIGNRQNIKILRTLQHIENNSSIKENDDNQYPLKNVKEAFGSTEKSTENNVNSANKKSSYEDIINTIGKALSKNDMNRIRAYIMNETNPPTTTAIIQPTQNIPGVRFLNEHQLRENICSNYSVCKPNDKVLGDNNENDYNLNINQILNLFKAPLVRKNRVVKSIKKKVSKSVRNMEELRTLLSNMYNNEETGIDEQLENRSLIEEESQKMQKNYIYMLNDVLMKMHNKFGVNEDSQYEQYDTGLRNIQNGTSESKETTILGHPNDAVRHVITGKSLNEILHPKPSRNRKTEKRAKKKVEYKQKIDKRDDTLTKNNPLNQYPIVQNLKHQIMYPQNVPQRQIITKDDADDYAIIKIKKPIKGREYVIDFNLLETEKGDLQNENIEKSIQDTTLKDVVESKEISRTETERSTVVHKTDFFNPLEKQNSSINLKDLVEQVKTIVLNDLKKTTIRTTTVQTEIPNEATTKKGIQDVRDANIVIPLSASSIVEIFNILNGKTRSTEAPIEQLSDNNKMSNQNQNNFNYPFGLTGTQAIQKSGIGKELTFQPKNIPRTMQTNSNFIPPIPIPIDVMIDEPYRMALENQQITVKSSRIPQRAGTDEKYNAPTNNSPSNHAKHSELNDDIKLNIKINEKRKHNFKHHRGSKEHDNNVEYDNDAHREKHHLYRTDKSGENAFKYGRNREKTLDELPKKRSHSDYSNVENGLEQGESNYNKLNYGNTHGEETFVAHSSIDNIAQRHQVPMNNINKGRPSTYDDTHFQNFLKTQEKVNDMLEQLLSKNRKHDRTFINVEGI